MTLTKWVACNFFAFVAFLMFIGITSGYELLYYPIIGDLTHLWAFISFCSVPAWGILSLVGILLRPLFCNKYEDSCGKPKYVVRSGLKLTTYISWYIKMAERRTMRKRVATMTINGKKLDESN